MSAFGYKHLPYCHVRMIIFIIHFSYSFFLIYFSALLHTVWYDFVVVWNTYIAACKMIWSCIFQPCDMVRHFPGPVFSVALISVTHCKASKRFNITIYCDPYIANTKSPWTIRRWRFCDPSLHCFDTVPVCDRQTDGRPCWRQLVQGSAWQAMPTQCKN